MNTMKICSGCQKPLEANGPDGLCPECLLKAGLGTGVDMGPDSEGGSGRTPFVAPSLEEVAGLFPQVEILGFIGQGGMGAVYKARQKSLDRVVALKILPPGIGKDAAFAERFTREAKALARLNHPGVVTIYEFGQADGLFFFLMEFVDGMSLRHLLELERISAREALAIVPQICDALQYAHDQGIVHRDIKPENILLDRQGRVKVADFGLAKLVGTDAEGGPLTPALSPSGGEGAPALTEAGNVMGTPQYMAPEQWDHPTEVDHRADIYSLGVVFYQMLTGELPGKPIEAPSHKVQIDVRLDEVVLRALEKEPQRRYQQVSQVKTAVEEIAQSRSPADASPQPADWRTWGPFQSPQVREICAHMTEAERREVTLRGALFGIWNAATFFLPCGIAFLAPKPLNWIFAPAVLLLGLAFYPLWQRIMREFLASTVWARQQGIAPGSLRMSPRIIVVGRRGGKAVIHWPGVLLVFMLVLALAEAGAILASLLLEGRIGVRSVGIAFGSAVIFTGMLVRLGRTTSVEQLTNLDGPGGTGPKPEGEKAGGAWDICAPDAPRWAHALLAAAAVLIPLGAYVGRGLLQGAKPTQDIPSQFAGIVILLAVGALAIFLAWQASRYLQTLLRLGRTTPVEKLMSLDGPGGTAPSPARPAATRGRLLAALIVGVLVWLFVAGTVALFTWNHSWKNVAIISCPHKLQPGRSVGEHFEFIASMVGLIRSDVILGRVIDRLQLDERSGKLDQRWGEHKVWLKLPKAQAMVLLKQRLDVRSEGGTLDVRSEGGTLIQVGVFVIQVGVFGKRPEKLEEVMDIANTIAEELRAYRIEQQESPADMLEMSIRFGLRAGPPDILLGLAAGLVPGLLVGGLVLWRGFLRRGSQASQVRTAVETTAAGVPATEPPAVETAARFGASGIEQIRREVKGPAIGLLVTAILNWILIPVAFAVVAPFAGAQPHVPGERPFLRIALLAIAALGLCSFITYAAVKMMRLKARGAALVASVLAIIVTPGNIIGLPLGIWALVTLNRREVRAAFTGDKAVLASALGSTARPHAAWPWVVAAVGMVVLVPVVLTSLSLYVPALARKSALQQQRLAWEQARLTAAESVAPQFGPVIETLIATADADDQGWGFFDMETGKSFKPPFPLTFRPNQGPAFVELTPELKQWIKARDVDVLLHLGEKTWDLMTLEMQEDFGGQLNEWETISPEKVIGIFAKKDAEHLVRDEVAASSFEHNYPDEGSFNAVWPPSSSSGLKMPFKAFRTRSNTMGVYQLQGMGNSNRRGVGIRYKVVQGH